LPETMGGSLKQSYPALWRKMAMSNFGQFHGDVATFVYLKVELTTQYETRREYFLVSYIKNTDIAANFSQWRNILIIGSVLITLLASLVIFLTHLYRIEQRSREFSIDMTNRLFDSELGCIIANDSGRVLTANSSASKLLALPIDELSDRSLQRILNLNDDQYLDFIKTVDETEHWQSELYTDTTPHIWLKISVRIEVSKDENRRFMLVTFEDISELKQIQEEAMLNRLLHNGPTASVLTDAKGVVVKSNSAFNTLLQVEDST
ncbi:PAS domain-containing protein, partial [Shewanella sp. 0m-11]